MIKLYSVKLLVLQWLLFIYMAEQSATRAINSMDGDGPPNSSDSDDEETSCEKLTELMLAQILGPAYNSRYMSIEVPSMVGSSSTNGGYVENGYLKRRVDSELPFSVDDTYSMGLNDIPAWEPDSYNMATMSMMSDERHKRSAHSGRRQKMTTIEQKPSRPWECQATIKWLDLGYDYFPRFIRTIECEQHRCWYGHYTCQPRSFTIKLLRRRNGECVKKQRKTTYKVPNRIGNAGLPDELRELWIWEERAINFCCDCAAPNH